MFKKFRQRLGGFATGFRNFGIFAGAILASKFVFDIVRGASDKTQRAVESAVFGASIFFSHAALSLIAPQPLALAGAIAIGMGVRHIQNKARGRNKIRSDKRKRNLTATALGGAILGAILGGGIGAAIGAVLGRFFAGPIINKVSSVTRPRGGSVNMVTRVTDQFAFIPNAFSTSIAGASSCAFFGCLSLFIGMFIIGTTTIFLIFYSPHNIFGIFQGQPVTPTTCGERIAQEATTITNDLARGFWNYFNRSLTLYPNLFNQDFFLSCPFPPYRDYSTGTCSNPREPTGGELFWCNDLLTHSYRRAGLNSPPVAGVTRQKGWFQTQGAYRQNGSFEINDTLIGAAIFFGSGFSWTHDAIVTAVGSDSITIRESNNTVIQRHLTISEDGRTIQGGVHGFGLPVCN